MAAAAAVLPLLGSLVGAGGQVAGGIAGQPSNSSADQTFTQFDPFGLPNFVTTQNDAARLLGGPGLQTPTEYQNLISRIMALPLDNKRKRRGLSQIIKIKEALDSGNDFTGPGGFSFIDKNLGSVLGRLGLDQAGLVNLIQTSNMTESRNKLAQENLRQANFRTQRDRADAAQGASALLGDAGRYVQGGEAGAFQTGVLDRINRNIDEQEDALLLRSSFGGFQPGEGLRGLGLQRTDAPQTALEQALAASAGLTQGLGGGLTLAQNTANSGNAALQGAAGLTAQQAMAANQIRASNEQASASSLASGIGAGSAAAGTGLSNFGLALGGGRQSPTTTSNANYESNNQNLFPQYYS